jgi:uncharacterized protein (TIGR03663 family)
VTTPALRWPRRRGIRAAVAAWAAPWWREAVPFAALTGMAAVVRAVGLGDKPMHHDEAQHAWFAWRILEGQGYAYDPVFHGPLQFYSTTLAHLLIGAGEASARAAPLLMGTIAVFLPFFLRRQLGTAGALTASALLCLTPSYLYFSRFAREDIYFACITLAVIVVLLRFLDEARRWHPTALLGLAALSFATKETTYISVFVAGLFMLAVGVAELVRSRRGGPPLRETRVVGGVLSLGGAAWAWGASAFLIVYALLFSSFLTNPAGLKEGLWGSIDYWLSQQDVGRGGQPWFYYLVLIAAYEWATLLLGLVGIVAVARRPTLHGAFLVWYLVGTLAIFSWASERMPWLVLHPLLPLVLLAGIGAQALWAARGRLPAQIALGAAAVAAAASVWFAFGAAFERQADPRELLVQVQSSDDVPRIQDEVVELQRAASRTARKPVVLQVDSWGGTGWPWSWYLRDVPVGYYDMSVPEEVPLGPIVLVADPNHEAMRPRLGDYVGKRFRLRVWWVPEYGAAGPRGWFRWVTRREAWNATATMDEWLYVRRDLARRLTRSAAARGAGRAAP